MEAPPDSGPQASASALAPLRASEVARLREEQEKVVTNCQEKIQHWKKVDNDYNALQERLSTLPDKLSYNIMVYIRKTIDDLKKVMKNFESRVEFTEDLQKMSDAASDIVDIREEIKNDFECKVKHRIAHKPHSKPKTSDIFEADFANDVKYKDLLADQELWARLEELERQEELLGELDSRPSTVISNGEDTTSSEEEKEDQNTRVKTKCQVTDSVIPSGCHNDSELVNGQVNSHLNCSVNGSNSYHSNEDDDDDDDEDDDIENEHDALGVGDNSVPTIYFSHTVEPKKVRINTGKNTTLKFSEKKEEAKRKRRSGSGGAHSAHEPPTIRTPADIYRQHGHQVPADMEKPEFDTSAFSGTVIEKEFLSPSLPPHPAISHPVLPTIPERKEVMSEASEETTKRVSKFKAARLQQKN
ncbi:unconventional prefoldin RPB5 interactor 1 [Orycteropus afer afer]|uniref:Unconventional prefoldin RPB5 interactor 1 n=1 Tax=Orycteropus afer afer TaxID=1230840 RepID=A0A8B7AD86_ORYAF|nr:unconventional prefoldin RPB5 interactor 1 [Orycteropus afer afer]